MSTSDVGGYHAVLGAALRRRRRADGVLLVTVSRKAGISVGHLCEIERGNSRAGSEVLTAICQALDTPMSMLIRETADELELQEMEVAYVGAA